MATIADSWELMLSAANDAEDVVDVLSLARFASGEHAALESFSLAGVARVDDLVPVGSIVRRARWKGNRHLLAEGDGWLAMVHRYPDGETFVRLSAVDDEVLSKQVAAIRSAAPPPPNVPGDVQVQFFFQGHRGPERRARRLAAPSWVDVARNYPAGTAEALAALTTLDPTAGVGRLLVWHGPPGTGKTTATRVLLREWRAWCRSLVITDPELLFGDPSYLMKLLLEVDNDNDNDRWRLLVIEDADELLRPDARERSGAVLSRLLNASDGLIGQGLKVLVLLTTNQQRVAIDQALLRPGRCLAEIAFDRFDRDEAAVWLDDGTHPSRDVSLAELYRLRSGGTLDDAAPLPGQYL